MKRLLLSILIAWSVWTIMSRGPQLVTQIISSEYRELKKFSDEQSGTFDANLRKALSNRPARILIKTLTPFSWDKVCIFSEGRTLRRSARHPNHLNKDYPALSGFGKLEKDALVFLIQDRIVGIVLSSDLDVEYSTKFCATYEKAKLIPFRKGSSFKDGQSGIFYRDRNLESIEPLEECKSTEICSYVFTGL